MNKDVTLKELLNGKIGFSSEYGDSYYVRPKPEHDFDERVYKINKRTGKMTLIHLIEYFPVANKAKEVDIDAIKRALL